MNALYPAVAYPALATQLGHLQTFTLETDLEL
jgi:hypothetical protein